MSESVLLLIENATRIAWEYLELTGQIDDPEFTTRFLLDTVQGMIKNGERRRLLLSNNAITAYERLKQGREALKGQSPTPPTQSVQQFQWP